MWASQPVGSGQPPPGGGPNDTINLDSSPEPDGAPNPVSQDGPASRQALAVIFDPRQPDGWRAVRSAMLALDRSTRGNRPAAPQGPNDDVKGQAESDGGKDDPANEYPRALLQIPDFGIPLGDPATPIIRSALHNTMSSMDLRSADSLTIDYTDGPSRQVCWVAPRDNVPDIKDFIYYSPGFQDEIVGVASVSLKGLRTVLQGLRLVCLEVMTPDQVPSEADISRRARLWGGGWPNRISTVQGYDPNTPGRVEGYYSFVDPWSAEGARLALEMMQQAARLRAHGSRVVIGSSVVFHTSPPQQTSEWWPLPCISFKRM